VEPLVAGASPAPPTQARAARFRRNLAGI
jgi:hypothetical protein